MRFSQRAYYQGNRNLVGPGVLKASGEFVGDKRRTRSTNFRTGGGASDICLKKNKNFQGKKG